MGVKVKRPVELGENHDLSQFDCGNVELNDWLKRKALKNHKNNASKTFVILEADSNNVVGFFCVSAGSVNRVNAPGGISRNQPDPIPVIVLGRLAIDQSIQGQGYGGQLVKFAYEKSQKISKSLGVRALMVNAKDEASKRFYERYGFIESCIDPLLLFKKI